MNKLSANMFLLNDFRASINYLLFRNLFLRDRGTGGKFGNPTMYFIVWETFEENGSNFSFFCFFFLQQGHFILIIQI